MRISDWSSDVCSSDLAGRHRWVLPSALARVTFRAKERLANGKLVGTSRSTALDQMRMFAGTGDEAAQQGRTPRARPCARTRLRWRDQHGILSSGADREFFGPRPLARTADRKSTRLNSSH